ncbi:MAG TPA: hypothetical protein VF625_14590, partial [Longimicrobium sp.]
APTVAVASAGTLYTNTARVTIAGTLSDDVKVTRATVQADGGPEQEITIVAGAEVSFSAEVAFSPNVRNAVVVHAYDAAGNRGSSDTVHIEFDTLAPGFDVYAPREGMAFSTEAGAAQQVEVGATVNGPFKHAGVRVNGGTETIVPPSAECATCFRARISGLREGENVLQVAAYDAAGNHTVKTIRILWSERARITVNTPSSLPLTVTTPTVRIAGIATHPTGVTRVFYSVNGGNYVVLPGTGTAIPFDFETPLWPGRNGINILATYGAGHDVVTSIVVTREAGPDANGVFSAVRAGHGGTSCGIARGSTLYCWGLIPLPDFAFRTEVTPRAHPGGAGISFTRMAAGYPGCALATGGAAYCWGRGADGQLGDGTRIDRERLAPVAGGLRFATIAHNSVDVCAVTVDGAGYCWGNGDSGMIGNGAFNDATTPTLVAGGHRWMEIALSAQNACGLTSAGALYCWGGQAANGSNQAVASPSPLGNGPAFTTIAGGAGSFCALDTAGAPYCWGMITYFALSFSAVPVRVAGGPALRSLTVGANHACGLTEAGAAYCWGDNREGQLGDGTTSTTNVRTPVAVTGGHVFTSVSAGAGCTCGVTANGAAFCWGAGDRGQLGNGLTARNL